MPGKKTRIFLDSNVIVSGLFSDRGAPRIILDILSLDLPALKPMTGAYNIGEIERTLRVKLPAALSTFRTALKLMNPEIVALPSEGDLAPLVGLTAAKDLPVIASAISGKADILVTCDVKHLLKIEKSRLSFKIASPADFLDDLLPEILKNFMLSWRAVHGSEP
ncbi:MAG: PIN domain-containing protein [Acidobacteriota bacterium]|nr:PIN domain-containing protein [Acidobacteriota bacterium]